MSYLVSGTWVEVGALATPEQVGQFLEQAVIPSLEMFARWEEEGRIAGGVFAGERETAFVLNAGSAEEVGQLLTSLPFWGMMKWQGWVVANQPELHLVLSHRAGLIAGRAIVGCRVHGHVEGLLLRLGNLRLARVADPQSGDWSLAAGSRPEELPKLQLQGQAIDLH